MVLPHAANVDARGVGEQDQDECEFGDEVNHRMAGIDVGDV